MNVTLVAIVALVLAGFCLVTVPLLILDGRNRRRNWQAVIARRRAQAHQEFLNRWHERNRSGR